jgi:hydroxymethylbilane synthase
VRIHVGTRGSPLALAQAEAVAARLRAQGAQVELVPIRTSGDRLAQARLAEVGGKGLFVKEIEEALLDGRVDLAVHSLKDLPAVLPDELTLSAFPPRADPRDVLIAPGGPDLEALPRGATVGTSSPRRRVLLLTRRPDLRPTDVRGNVETRLAKLQAGAYDALILARAGLHRLGLDPPDAVSLDPAEFVPAVGQGILAVEMRRDAGRMLALLESVDDTRTRMEAQAERAFLAGLGADCHTPVAGHAECRDGQLRLTGLVASADARSVLRATLTGSAGDAVSIGARLAQDLLARGADRLLAPPGEGKP